MAFLGAPHLSRTVLRQGVTQLYEYEISLYVAFGVVTSKRGERMAFSCVEFLLGFLIRVHGKAPGFQTTLRIPMSTHIYIRFKARMNSIDGNALPLEYLHFLFTHAFERSCSWSSHLQYQSRTYNMFLEIGQMFTS